MTDEPSAEAVRLMHRLRTYGTGKAEFALTDKEAAQQIDAFAARRVAEELERLARIAHIIESVDTRCMAVDGPVTPTLQEMEQDEISRIYALAMRKAENWKP